MQVSTTFSLLFWINKAKINHNKAPIWVRITVNGVRAEMSIKRNIAPNDWSSDKGQAKGTKEEARIINHYIEQIRTQLYQYYQSMMAERKFVTAEALPNLQSCSSEFAIRKHYRRICNPTQYINLDIRTL